MEKLLFFAFVLSPGALFAFLRAPETPTLTPTFAPALTAPTLTAPALTLAARASCQVTAVNAIYETSLGAASGQGEQFASSPGDAPRELDR